MPATAAGLLLLGHRGHLCKLEDLQLPGPWTGPKVWEAIGKWECAAVLSSEIVQALRNHSKAQPRVVSSHTGEATSVLRRQLAASQDEPISQGAIRVGAAVVAGRKLLSPISTMAYVDILDEGIDRLCASAEAVLRRRPVSRPLAGLDNAEKEYEADLGVSLRGLLLCVAPHILEALNGNEALEPLAKALKRSLVARPKGLVGEEPLKRASSIASLLLRSESPASSFASQSETHVEARAGTVQTLQCSRTVLSGLEKATAIAWASRCRVEFSMAITVAREEANKSLLACGRAAQSEGNEIERAAARAAAIWGAYLVAADSRHGAEDFVVHAVLSGLASLRHLDASVLDLLAAQLKLSEAGPKAERALHALRQAIEKCKSSQDPDHCRTELVGDLLAELGDSESSGESRNVSAKWGSEAIDFISHIETGLRAWHAVSEGSDSGSIEAAAWRAHNTKLSSSQLHDRMTLELHRLLAEGLMPEEALHLRLPQLQECFIHPLIGKSFKTTENAELALASLLGCGASSPLIHSWEMETVTQCAMEEDVSLARAAAWQEPPSFLRSSRSLELTPSTSASILERSAIAASPEASVTAMGAEPSTRTNVKSVAGANEDNADDRTIKDAKLEQRDSSANKPPQNTSHQLQPEIIPHAAAQRTGLKVKVKRVSGFSNAVESHRDQCMSREGSHSGFEAPSVRHWAALNPPFSEEESSSGSTKNNVQEPFSQQSNQSGTELEAINESASQIPDLTADDAASSQVMSTSTPHGPSDIRYGSLDPDFQTNTELKTIHSVEAGSVQQLPHSPETNAGTSEAAQSCTVGAGDIGPLPQNGPPLSSSMCQSRVGAQEANSATAEALSSSPVRLVHSMKEGDRHSMQDLQGHGANSVVPVPKQVADKATARALDHDPASLPLGKRFSTQAIAADSAMPIGSLPALASVSPDLDPRAMLPRLDTRNAPAAGIRDDHVPSLQEPGNYIPRRPGSAESVVSDVHSLLKGEHDSLCGGDPSPLLGMGMPTGAASGPQCNSEKAYLGHGEQSLQATASSVSSSSIETSYDSLAGKEAQSRARADALRHQRRALKHALRRKVHSSASPAAMSGSAIGGTPRLLSSRCSRAAPGNGVRLLGKGPGEEAETMPKIGEKGIKLLGQADSACEEMTVAAGVMPPTCLSIPVHAPRLLRFPASASDATIPTEDRSSPESESAKSLSALGAQEPVQRLVILPTEHGKTQQTVSMQAPAGNRIANTRSALSPSQGSLLKAQDPKPSPRLYTASASTGPQYAAESQPNTNPLEILHGLNTIPSRPLAISEVWGVAEDSPDKVGQGAYAVAASETGAEEKQADMVSPQQQGAAVGVTLTQGAVHELVSELRLLREALGHRGTLQGSAHSQLPKDPQPPGSPVSVRISLPEAPQQRRHRAAGLTSRLKRARGFFPSPHKRRRSVTPDPATKAPVADPPDAPPSAGSTEVHYHYHLDGGQGSETQSPIRITVSGAKDDRGRSTPKRKSFHALPPSIVFGSQLEPVPILERDALPLGSLPPGLVQRARSAREDGPALFHLHQAPATLPDTVLSEEAAGICASVPSCDEAVASDGLHCSHSPNIKDDKLGDSPADPAEAGESSTKATSIASVPDAEAGNDPVLTDSQAPASDVAEDYLGPQEAEVAEPEPDGCERGASAAEQAHGEFPAPTSETAEAKTSISLEVEVAVPENSCIEVQGVMVPGEMQGVEAPEAPKENQLPEDVVEEESSEANSEQLQVELEKSIHKAMAENLSPSSGALPGLAVQGTFTQQQGASSPPIQAPGLVRISGSRQASTQDFTGPAGVLKPDDLHAVSRAFLDIQDLGVDSVPLSVRTPEQMLGEAVSRPDDDRWRSVLELEGQRLAAAAAGKENVNRGSPARHAISRRGGTALERGARAADAAAVREAAAAAASQLQLKAEAAARAGLVKAARDRAERMARERARADLSDMRKALAEVEALATELELDFVESHQRLEQVEAEGRGALTAARREGHQPAAP